MPTSEAKRGIGDRALRLPASANVDELPAAVPAGEVTG